MNLETLSACPLCGDDAITAADVHFNIWECKPCGYVFDNPRPALEELIRFYSQPTKYDSWLADEKPRDALWKRRLELLLPVIKPGSLLDVGTGIGQFLNAARPYFSSVCGTEVSESAIAIARKKYGLELLRGEIGTIDFGPMRFDNVTLFHVLEHVPNPRLTIERCRELLSPGGLLVIAVPNDVHSLRSGVRRIRRVIGLGEFAKTGKWALPRLILDGSIAEIHLSHFTSASLQKLVERCGFSVASNSLDPFYVASGLGRLKPAGFYQCCRALKAILGVNLYDTILVAARINDTIATGRG